MLAGSRHELPWCDRLAQKGGRGKPAWNGGRSVAETKTNGTPSRTQPLRHWKDVTVGKLDVEEAEDHLVGAPRWTPRAS
jgi:hypothetical protein